ncbi:type II toxin-antitoxin system VapC family toxin [Rhizobium sp. YIM 134829]|uniref:type II toxin-antitoxin system VapC family toxin n=1 Tax=Rhizobium sp. YIM 134829 TaxID=3390453 RepID=UPI00397C6935
MIVVDTSALLAILQDEPGSERLSRVLAKEQQTLLAAGNLTEAMIVASRRGLHEDMAALIATTIREVLPLTAERAERAAAAYRRFGKGFHSAGLNFGDCFAYATAEEFGCPLLFIGADFARTDLAPALPPH